MVHWHLICSGFFQNILVILRVALIFFTFLSMYHFLGDVKRQLLVFRLFLFICLWIYKKLKIFNIYVATICQSKFLCCYQNPRKWGTEKYKMYSQESAFYSHLMLFANHSYPHQSDHLLTFMKPQLLFFHLSTQLLSFLLPLTCI